MQIHAARSTCTCASPTHLHDAASARRSQRIRNVESCSNFSFEHEGQRCDFHVVNSNHVHRILPSRKEKSSRITCEDAGYAPDYLIRIPQISTLCLNHLHCHELNEGHFENKFNEDLYNFKNVAKYSMFTRQNGACVPGHVSVGDVSVFPCVGS